jgi:hypothetical protein
MPSYDESSKFPDSIQPAPDTVICDRCGLPKPRSEYYTRSGMPHLILNGCKECRKAAERAKAGIPRDPHAVHTPSEAWVIERLKSVGIPALPGKALHYAHADVVAFGCVLIEVKSSTLTHGMFRFPFTPIQYKSRIRGDLIVLVCDYGDNKTFHVLSTGHDIFFDAKGNRKTAVHFVPGQMAAVKHARRHVLVQPIMDAAQDKWALVWAALKAQSDALKEGA